MLQGTTDSATMPMLIAGALPIAISTVCEDVRECVVYNHGTHLNYTFYMLCFYVFLFRCHPRKMFQAAVNKVIVFIMVITSLRE